MPDPSLAVAEPTPDRAPLPLLAERYPACFNWDHPRPLKIGIHKDLLAAGYGGDEVKPAEIKRALARYCNRPRYRKTLREEVVRVDRCINHGFLFHE